MCIIMEFTSLAAEAPGPLTSVTSLVESNWNDESDM